MSNKHYSDDDLVARLFGLGLADAHLDRCELCSERWNQIRQRHQSRHAAETEVPAELLAAQRRAVYERLDQQSSRKLRSRWLPVPVAAVLLVLLMFAVFKPTPQKQSTDVISDDEVLQDVFTTASRVDPAGLRPVQSLFEVKK